MLKFCYTLAMYALQPLLLMRVWLRGRLQPLYAERWPERFGFYRDAPVKPVMWIHAVSMGESIAAAPLVDALIERYPQYLIVHTTMTATGAQRVQALHGNRVRHVYAPYDTPFAIARFLQHFKPRLLVVFEVELWPNWLAACDQQAIPVVLLNARLSSRSVQRYQKIRGFMQRMLSQVAVIGVQHDIDAQRFVSLGARPDKIKVLGNIKFDLKIDAGLRDKAAQLRPSWFPARRVFLAASTHEGEEHLAIEAFTALRSHYTDLLLVIVPRHPERFERVYHLSSAAGLTVQRRSELSSSAVLADCLVVDSLGELLLFYAMADVALVGGSLVPAGGHNPLEPAALDVPVLIGPHTYNAGWIVDELEAAGGLVRVTDARSLAESAGALLGDDARRTNQIAAARRYLTAQRGVCARMLDVCGSVLRV